MDKALDCKVLEIEDNIKATSNRSTTGYSWIDRWTLYNKISNSIKNPITIESTPNDNRN